MFQDKIHRRTFSTMSNQYQELFKQLRKLLSVIEKKGKDNNKAILKITIIAQGLKQILSGDLHQETEMAIATGFNEFITPLITHMAKFEFEAKKELAAIFCKTLRVQHSGESPTMDFILEHREILDLLFAGYNDPLSALNCGTMIRGCIANEELAKVIIESDHLIKLFDFIEIPSFDVGTDAFTTFKELLTLHSMMTSKFLEENYDKFFQHFDRLLKSENYVTQRQSLKLLGELLLDKVNFNVMTRYISVSKNLKSMMTLLCSDKHSIQFETFHVFKIFVANPNKPDQILKILKKNKETLIEFLEQFQRGNDDEQFSDEKLYLIRQIQLL